MKHCLSPKEPRVNTELVSSDIEIGIISMETSVSEGKFGLRILYICFTLFRGVGTRGARGHRPLSLNGGLISPTLSFGT